MADTDYAYGVALIVEGATERVFYSEFISSRAMSYGASVASVTEGDGTNLAITRGDGLVVLVKIYGVGAISQMTNSADWFRRACVARHDLPWFVFLGYDTDAYNSNITKFHEGDWARLRDDIGKDAKDIIDLAAEADIEDVMLCDYGGVLRYLGLPNSTDMPGGRKGKVKMKSLFRMVAINRPYHEGERARPLVRSLDMAAIMVKSPVPLGKLDEALFGVRQARV